MTSVGATHRKVLCYDRKKRPVMQAQLSEFGLVKPCFPASGLRVLVDDGESQWECEFKKQEEITKLVLEASIGLVSKFDASAGQGVKVVELSVGHGEEIGMPGDKAHISYVTYIHTAGSLTLGNAVDSNYDCPLEFKIGSGIVIPAFDQGVQGMRQGGVRLLCSPPSSAYGSSGLSGRVPKDATVVFHVTMSRLEKHKQGDTAAASAASYSPADPFLASLFGSSFDTSKDGESSLGPSPFNDSASEPGSSHVILTVPLAAFALPPSSKGGDEDEHYRTLSGASGGSTTWQHSTNGASLSANDNISDVQLHTGSISDSKGAEVAQQDRGSDAVPPGTPVPSLLGETIKSDKESSSAYETESVVQDASALSQSPTQHNLLTGHGVAIPASSAPPPANAPTAGARVLSSPASSSSAMSGTLSAGFQSNSFSAHQGPLFSRRRPDHTPVELSSGLKLSLSLESSIDGGHPRLRGGSLESSQVAPSPSQQSQQPSEGDVDPNVPPTFHFAGTCFISSINVKSGMFEPVVLPNAYDATGLLGCVILSHGTSQRKVSSSLAIQINSPKPFQCIMACSEQGMSQNIGTLTTFLATARSLSTTRKSRESSRQSFVKGR